MGLVEIKEGVRLCEDVGEVREGDRVPAEVGGQRSAMRRTGTTRSGRTEGSCRVMQAQKPFGSALRAEALRNGRMEGSKARK